MTLYEYEHNALTDEWKPLDKKTWLSWSGRRRLNGREYHGPIFFLGTDEPVVRQARVCPCDVCQQTNPWKVDALAYREQVTRLTRERDAALEALKRIKAMSAVAGYDFGDASIHNVARQTIQAIETGAIHDQR